MLPPDAYTDKRAWTKRATLKRWVSDRVLKLTCTADDMKPLAEACGFESLGGGVHKWKSQERLDFMAGWRRSAIERSASPRRFFGALVTGASPGTGLHNTRRNPTERGLTGAEHPR